MSHRGCRVTDTENRDLGILVFFRTEQRWAPIGTLPPCFYAWLPPLWPPPARLRLPKPRLEHAHFSQPPQAMTIGKPSSPTFVRHLTLSMTKNNSVHLTLILPRLTTNHNVRLTLTLTRFPLKLPMLFAILPGKRQGTEKLHMHSCVVWPTHQLFGMNTGTNDRSTFDRRIFSVETTEQTRCRGITG